MSPPGSKARVEHHSLSLGMMRMLLNCQRMQSSMQMLPRLSMLVPMMIAQSLMQLQLGVPPGDLCSWREPCS